MKNIKKVVAGIMVVASLSCITTTQLTTSAEYIGKSENYIDAEYIEFLEKNSVREAVIIVDVDYNDVKYAQNYYINLDENVFSPQEVDDSFDTSGVKNIININQPGDCFYVDEGDSYSIYIFYIDDVMGANFACPDSVIPKVTVGESDVEVGDSVETVGGSDTGIRGDINYDGKVNVSDLIYLRRYLLHLIKW